MLPGFHAGLEMLRAEEGGRGQDHNIHVGFYDPFIRIKTCKAVGIVQLCIFFFLEFFSKIIHPVLEYITHSYNA